MMTFSNPRTQKALARAVVISLFSWRKANSDDDHDGIRHGYWGDSFPPKQGALIGSRLWLLRRAKLITNQTLLDAETYIREALQWMIDDGITTAVDVNLQRTGVSSIGGSVTLHLPAGGLLVIPFSDIWQVNHAVYSSYTA